MESFTRLKVVKRTWRPILDNQGEAPSASALFNCAFRKFTSSPTVDKRALITPSYVVISCFLLSASLISRYPLTWSDVSAVKQVETEGVLTRDQM